MSQRLPTDSYNATCPVCKLPAVEDFDPDLTSWIHCVDGCLLAYITV